MARVANWPDILAAEIEDARMKPFTWGSWDCCHFANRVITALTGVDHSTEFPSYANEDEAWAIVAAAGGMEGLITKALGESKHVSRARRGDIVMIELELGLMPAVCLGAMCAATGAAGLVYLPTARAELAWSI